jgi:hypothetical protein
LRIYSSLSSLYTIVDNSPVRRLYMNPPRNIRPMQKNFSTLLTPEMSP